MKPGTFGCFRIVNCPATSGFYRISSTPLLKTHFFNITFISLNWLCNASSIRLVVDGAQTTLFITIFIISRFAVDLVLLEVQMASHWLMVAAPASMASQNYPIAPTFFLNNWLLSVYGVSRHSFRNWTERPVLPVSERATVLFSNSGLNSHQQPSTGSNLCYNILNSMSQCK